MHNGCLYELFPIKYCHEGGLVMKEKVYVFGHRNPDTDSICSAIAYANLKSLIDDEYDFEAAALGVPSNETQFVLDSIGMEAPTVIDHLRSQVTDLILGPVDYVNENSSIKELSLIHI